MSIDAEPLPDDLVESPRGWFDTRIVGLAPRRSASPVSPVPPVAAMNVRCDILPRISSSWVDRIA
ncbi:hypothetical protein A6E15_04465 [Natrinema saccharevitans]|uniref:Uncharacterized protein n=1 Tax=Natrinema saccharevitans TaxID=301967 RepID=A0A1S8ATY8_9EURY|nr:hypothetical protein A6E15_04465 [Natrinema saccharevitans]